MFKKRKRTRLAGYDYSTKGKYFVTICTKQNGNVLGKIRNDEILLNEEGQIVKSVWEELSNHNKNIDLHEFIIMPDHIHGIIEIREEVDRGLSEIIRQFKTFSSRQINDVRRGGLITLPEKNKFHWQRSFYDEIIRNKTQYDKIIKYINENIDNWKNE